MNEKIKLEHFLHDRGRICIMLPKFHCELNPIERCWGQATRYTRSFTNYILPRLRINIPNGLDSVSLDNITTSTRSDSICLDTLKAFLQVQSWKRLLRNIRRHISHIVKYLSTKMSDDEAALLHTCSDGYTPK